MKDGIQVTAISCVYKFSCAGCGACRVGETKRHLATRIREHASTDKNSQFYITFKAQKTAELYVLKIVLPSLPLTPPPASPNQEGATDIFIGEAFNQQRFVS